MKERGRQIRVFHSSLLAGGISRFSSEELANARQDVDDEGKELFFVVVAAAAGEKRPPKDHHFNRMVKVLRVNVRTLSNEQQGGTRKENEMKQFYEENQT